MSIYFRYGTYSHQAGECRVSIARTATKGQDGETIIGHTTRYTIDGVMHGSSASDFNAKLRALESAYSYDGKDFGLIDEAIGATAHFVRASEAEVRVVEGPSYPEGGGGEYATGRTYQIVIEAKTGRTIQGSYDFQESVTISGGGPRIVWLETLNGPPQQQMTALRTVCTITQEGQATSGTTWPPPSPPLFPGALVEMPTISRSSPQRLDTGRSTSFTTRWQYQFVLPSRADAYPHVR